MSVFSFHDSDADLIHSAKRDAYIQRIFGFLAHSSGQSVGREPFWQLPVLQQLQLLSGVSALSHVLSSASVRTIAAVCGRVRPGHVLFEVARKFIDSVGHIPSSVSSLPAEKKRCVFWADDNVASSTPFSHAAPAPHSDIVTCIIGEHVEGDEWRERMISALATAATCGRGSKLLLWSWEAEDVDWDTLMPKLVEAIVACLFEAAAVSVRALRAACAGFDGEHAPEGVLRDVVLGLVGGGFTRPSMEAIISCCLLPTVRRLDRGPSRCLSSTIDTLMDCFALACVNALVLPVLTCEHTPPAVLTPSCAQVVQLVLPKLLEDQRVHLIRSLLAQPPCFASETSVPGPFTLWCDLTYPIIQALVCAKPTLELPEDCVTALLGSIVTVFGHAKDSPKFLAMLLAMLPRLRDYSAFEQHRAALLAAAAASSCYLAKPFMAKLAP